ncbi:hypothetical protein ACFV4E_22875 [Streptomyces hygroscopicus]|uniref:Uncharacterized protein n=1 Tax=Streptomyces hygroscopicus TaxID=1912 RepID=A0ABQ3UFC7_STRHY|nr:hypothetical protein [Streptomyces hygroscopicus]GHJ34314.1 hypothetical protein TPA0910_87470 [Streptomyces hygroscopicus]
MRKRVSRPPRFAAVDNNAIDTISSILAIGLLTTLIRAKDGEDVTVETLMTKYDEGEKALTKAMRILVEGAFVVKFKIQRAASEAVRDENGKKVVKRGGSWYTTFTVDSIPFTLEDVTGMLADILDAGNVKAVRVEPTRLDPRKTSSAPTIDEPSRPTLPKGSVGPACGDTDSEAIDKGHTPGNSGPRPTPPSAGPGRPRIGNGGALYRNKTISLSDSAAAPAGPTADGEREAATPDQPTEDALQVLAAYEDALGGPAVNGTRTQLLADAAELLAIRPLWWVTDRARELPKYGKSLIRHAEMSKVPFTQPSAASGQVPAQRECPAGKCDGGGIIYRDPELQLGPRRCTCRTQQAPA